MARVEEETSIMPTCKQWICSSLLAVVTVAPVLAGTKDAADSKTPAKTAANPAAQPAPAANPNISSGNANVTALLGVLVMKGVLAPSEANAIRDKPQQLPWARLCPLTSSTTRF